MLARNRVQPREAFVAGNGDHESVTAVDHHCCALRGSLFAEGIAVVPRDTDVGRTVRCGDRAGGSQKWAVGHKSVVDHETSLGVWAGSRLQGGPGGLADR